MKTERMAMFSFLIAAVLTAAILSLFWHKSGFSIYTVKPTYEISEITAKSEQSNLEQEKSYVQLLFVGDIMFDRGIRYYAGKNGLPAMPAHAGQAGGNEFIFDKISPTLLGNDLVVANLEGPITDNKSVSAGTAIGSANNYFFTFDPSWAKTLFQENIRLVDLGNNHILNFGKAGVDSTEKYLDNAGVDYFGAPSGDKSIIKNIGGVKIAFVSYNQFLSSNIADEQKATIAEIEKIKSEADIVVVFSHWGIEYQSLINPPEESLARQFIDAGADLVVGSHPHVIGPIEIYKGKRIYYSLGNFIFDQYFNEDVRNGLGVVVKIDKATKQLDFSEQKFYLQNNGQTLLR